MGYPCGPLCKEDSTLLVTLRMSPTLMWTIPLCRTCTLGHLWAGRVLHATSASTHAFDRMFPYAAHRREPR